MRNTRSQGVAPFSVARSNNSSNNSSNKKSTCGKRRVSIDSTDSVSNCKRININAHSTRRPVSSVNKHYDDEDDNLESEEDKADVLEEEDEEEEDEDDEVARTQKKKGTAVPPHILTEAIAIQKLYKQQKAMLSIMGNISKFTLDKALGELGGRQKPGCYQLWLKYSKERQKHRMPLKGGSKEYWQTAIRNWERSGILYPMSTKNDSNLDDDDENEHGPVPRLDLEPEHRAELQALYDELVCKDKVAKQYAKVAAGMGQGPSLPDYNRQSQKCIERIHTQIENKANNMDFSYYLLSCSTHASTEAPSGSPGWCLEFISHDEMAIYVNKQSNFARVFAARTQGLSVAEVVAQTIGSKVMSNTEKSRKTDPGDIVKANLAALLRAQFFYYYLLSKILHQLHIYHATLLTLLSFSVAMSEMDSAGSNEHNQVLIPHPTQTNATPSTALVVADQMTIATSPHQNKKKRNRPKKTGKKFKIPVPTSGELKTFIDHGTTLDGQGYPIYPNGETVFVRKAADVDDIVNFGHVSYPHTQKSHGAKDGPWKTTWFTCLGVLQCDNAFCDYAAPPPTGDGKAAELIRSTPICPAVECDGNHIWTQCPDTSCRFDVEKATGWGVLWHSGHHNHIWPDRKKADPLLMRTFTDVVVKNPKAGPLVLKFGSLYNHRGFHPTPPLCGILESGLQPAATWHTGQVWC
ncbi:hypothetical protein DFH28DRAFT_927483 [Melampsora americana]|nr:hypothetical protein DFH28DRAFT_927483 [Melampsora americana]